VIAGCLRAANVYGSSQMASSLLIDARVFPQTKARLAVYTIAFKQAVYVLHCFQKKSPRGKKTAKPDVDLIHERLQAARKDHKQRYGKEAK
jgi:phage-related protein